VRETFILGAILLVCVSVLFGFSFALMMQFGIDNDDLSSDHFFKDCNFGSSTDCSSSHFFLFVVFVVLSVMGMFFVYRESSSILVPAFIYYIFLVFGFLVEALS